jgi:hypothetical protein
MTQDIVQRVTRKWPAWLDARLLVLALLFGAIAAMGLTVATGDTEPAADADPAPAAIESQMEDAPAADLIARVD